MDLKQAKRKKLVDDGVVMANYKAEFFKFNGRYYTTNLKRKKMYKMDDDNWIESIHQGFLWKLMTVLLGRSKKLKG